MISAKAMPLSTPTINSRRMMRQALALESSRVASARTATVMVWVPALPPMLATIGISTASATIFWIDPSNWLITQDASSAVSRFANSQGKRPLAMVQTESDSSSSRPTPPNALMSSSASSSITSTMSSKVITPTSRSVVIDDRGGDEVVALEQPRDLLLVVGRRAPAEAPR